MGIEHMALMIPVIALCIPIVAILVAPYNNRMAQSERREARHLYERIVMEKMDVIKTALAMGMEKDDLADLDARLERLVGADKLAVLLEEKKAPKTPATPVDADLRDADLEREIERLQKKREKE